MENSAVGLGWVLNEERMKEKIEEEKKIAVYAYKKMSFIHWVKIFQSDSKCAQISSLTLKRSLICDQ